LEELRSVEALIVGFTCLGRKLEDAYAGELAECNNAMASSAARGVKAQTVWALALPTAYFRQWFPLPFISEGTLPPYAPVV
jgi:hypothetical protein